MWRSVPRWDNHPEVGAKLVCKSGLRGAFLRLYEKDPSLWLIEDEYGNKVRVEPCNVQRYSDIQAAIRRGGYERLEALKWMLPSVELVKMQVVFRELIAAGVLSD